MACTLAASRRAARATASLMAFPGFELSAAGKSLRDGLRERCARSAFSCAHAPDGIEGCCCCRNQAAASISWSN